MAEKENQDKEEIIETWRTFLETFQEQNQHFATTFFEGMQQRFPFPPTLLGDVFIKTAQSLLNDPSSLVNAQENLLEETQGLWQKMLSFDNATPSESIPDKRFRHDAWQFNPYFLFMKEYYLITSRWLQNLVSQLDGIDAQTSQKIQFYTKQMTEAISPTNFPFTNPEVLEELVKTQGASLRKGYENLLEDLEGGQWMKMTDPSAFTLGENIASTEGRVVFRNDIFELIHYTPRTKTHYSVPLLIIPPWINKFYIFDLSPSNSFIKWTLEQGHDVFIISWVNPGTELGSKSFENYLLDGAYKACKQVSHMTGSPTLNTIGYCVGGSLLAALSAYLTKNPSNFSLQTMTLLATIIDFSRVGDLKIFMDDEYLEFVEDSMSKNGFLEADTLKSIFSLLKPNDLVWSFFIKNYLLGQIPPAFDFLYWNSDSIRLPATLHSFILRKCFQENLLMKPGGLSVNQTLLDLRDISTPTFLLATEEDHISPWKSCYPAVHLFKGPLKFILAGSGHVAGVMNPPSRNKYGFLTNSDFPENEDDWFNGATKHEGSWWTAWNDWLSPFSGGKITPLAPYPSLGPAPGTYVKEK